VFFFAVPYTEGESAEMMADDSNGDTAMVESVSSMSPGGAYGGSDTAASFERQQGDRPFEFRPPRSSEGRVHNMLIVEEVPDPPLSGRRENNASVVNSADAPGVGSASISVSVSERINAPAPNSAPLMLIVDDAVPTLKVVTRSLAADGIVIETATDGFTALNMMKKRLYTCVLMDIQIYNGRCRSYEAA
jgi:CheY-like chemotaxis protein